MLKKVKKYANIDTINKKQLLVVKKSCSFIELWSIKIVNKIIMHICVETDKQTKIIQST